MYDYVAKDNEPYRGNAEGKVAIPRIATPAKALPPLSPKLEKNVKYKTIQPKPEICDIVPYNPQLTLSVQAAEPRSHQDSSDTGKCKRQRRKKAVPEQKDSTVPPLVSQEPQTFTRERLASVGSVDKDAMDEYLGTSNSQEHEEELLKYFKNNNTDDACSEQENSSKLSQLRQLLEQNGIADTRLSLQKAEANCLMLHKRNLPKGSVKSNPQCRRNIPPNIHTSTTRRRVSFETPLQEETVPASPNSRRKNFSFTPISPGPLSPSGRQSKSSSTNASPFVSPRNTPVARARMSTHQNTGVYCFAFM